MWSSWWWRSGPAHWSNRCSHPRGTRPEWQRMSPCSPRSSAPDRVSAVDALRLMRTAVDLDEAALVDASIRSASAVDDVATGAAVPAVPAGRHRTRVSGSAAGGRDVSAVKDDYVTTLATAVARAWESEQLSAQQHGADLSGAVDSRAVASGGERGAPLADLVDAIDALESAVGGLDGADRRALLNRIRQEITRLEEIVGPGVDPSRVDNSPNSLERPMSGRAASTQSGEAINPRSAPRGHG